MSYSTQTWVDNSTPLSAARLNNIEAGILNADFTTCTSTTRPATPFDGQRIYETDTKAFGFYDTTNLTWHMWDTVNQTFTPTFTTVGGTPSVGNGTLTGYYRRMGKLCWIKINFAAGSTTNGGTGSVTFGIPNAIAARTDNGEQWIPTKVYTNANSQNWIGATWMYNTVANPYAPASQTACTIMPLRSADSSGAVSTGYPLVSGNYTLATSSNIYIEGTYELNVG